MAGDFQIVLCTCPDVDVATEIATHLVGAKLAACVNILPAVTSIYEWQGEIKTAPEVLLMIKSHQGLYHYIESEIIQLHPYELPEVIVVPVRAGFPEYLEWMDSCLLSE